MIAIQPMVEADFAFAWELVCESIGPLASALGAWDEAREREIVRVGLSKREARCIVVREERIGWLHVRATVYAIELWQLFLSPRWRGRGIGSAVLRELMTQARIRDVPVVLRVLRNNRARQLYERCGFIDQGGDDQHLHMTWWPGKLD